MNPTLKRTLQVVSFFGLGLSLVPAFMLYAGAIETQTYLNIMLLGMFLWFGSAIFWIKKDELG